MSLAINIPVDNIIYKKELIVSKLVLPNEKLTFQADYLFPLFRLYSSKLGASALYFAAEADGNYISYGLVFGRQWKIAAKFTDPTNYLGESAQKNHLYSYRIDDYGYPINAWQPGGAYINITYDPRLRPWYKPVKLNPVKQWSAPYIDATTGNPTLTIVNPIFNSSVHSNRSFIGTMACDLYLSSINSFLEMQYQGTDRIVFIIEKSSNNLIGNSLSLPNYAVTSKGAKVIMIWYRLL